MIESLNHSEQATVLDHMHTATMESSEDISTTELSGAVVPGMMDSGNGLSQVALNSSVQFDPTGQQIKNIDALPSLLLPSANNIQALKTQSSSQFKQMLLDHLIPFAPETISFDSAGEMQLPPDYVYAEELHQAFEHNEGIRQMLSSLNALSSHYVEMQARTPFVEAMNNATTQIDIERVIAQYRRLLQGNNNYISTALLISAEGELGVTADGEAVSFYS